jgi:hypothetical protein
MGILFFLLYSFAILYTFFIGYKVLQHVRIGNFVLKEVASNLIGFAFVYFSLYAINGYYLNSVINERSIVTGFAIFFTIYAGTYQLYKKTELKRVSIVLAAITTLILLTAIVCAIIETIVGGVWT